jgi:SAM-dependent methyltransferase
MTNRSGANADQITYWNEVSGPKWVAMTDRINEQIAPLGIAAMDRARVGAGESVLDVGCGCGQTSLALGERVGEGGRVLGLDISEPMLNDARARAKRSGATNVEFVRADAQIHAFEPTDVDLIFSRFGIMFFDDPTAAFANLRTALRAEGRLTFICWQALAKNPWMFVPAAAAAQHVALAAPSDPTAPGPFAFADADRVVGILQSAGFADVSAEAHEGRLAVGRGLALDEIVGFMQQLGPAGAALREASADVVQAVTDSIREALTPYYSEDGVVMDFGAWILTASKG